MYYIWTYIIKNMAKHLKYWTRSNFMSILFQKYASENVSRITFYLRLCQFAQMLKWIVKTSLSTCVSPCLYIGITSSFFRGKTDVLGRLLVQHNDILLGLVSREVASKVQSHSHSWTKGVLTFVYRQLSCQKSTWRRQTYIYISS